MIEIIDAGYRAGTRWLWRNLSVRLEAGAVCGILGRNGAGKTTLLRAVAGLIPLNEGRIRSEGVLGYVPQRSEISFPFSARDVVVMGRARHLRLFAHMTPADDAAVDEAMRFAGIESLAPREFTGLSGGERQLVLMARALASGADRFALDEPLAGLDLVNQRRVLQLIRMLALERRCAVLFSTHDPDHLFAVADQVLMIDAGVHESGLSAQMLTSGRLSRLYGVDLQVISMPTTGQCASRHAVALLDPALPGYKKSEGAGFVQKEMHE